MSRCTTTVVTCDGCGRNDIDDDLEIVYSEYYDVLIKSDRTIDLCADCKREGRYYICRLCRTVHDDAHPCEGQRIRVEAAS